MSFKNEKCVMMGFKNKKIVCFFALSRTKYFFNIYFSFSSIIDENEIELYILISKNKI